MTDQILDTMTVNIKANEYLFRSNGHNVTFDGFTKLYEAASDEKGETVTDLPSLEENTTLHCKELKPAQRFTQPPMRFSEATLIKTLEENGIGRPSTYAPIISTIIDRGYVERDQKSLKPTSLGVVVTDLMIDQFPNIVDEKFSAGMEKALIKRKGKRLVKLSTVL